MKKLKIISGWLILALYLVLIPGFVNKKDSLNVCSSIDVSISDSLTHKFVVADDVIEFIDLRKSTLRGYPLNGINTLELETMLEEIPSVKTAEAYKTVDGRLCLDIEQRIPIIRIIDKKGRSFYIDKEGYFLPRATHYTAHVLVANGNIPSEGFKPKTNVFQLRDANGNEGQHVLAEIYRFAKFIEQDKLWSAQFLQLYRNASGEYELIPRVGSHIIIMGKIDDFKEKLRKLEAVYLKGFNSVGWNQYEFINLKYTNQVVCTKR